MSKWVPLQKWTQPILGFLENNKNSLPTVQIIVASMLLFGTMDMIDSQFDAADYGWSGGEKLVALGIIAATRLLTLLITIRTQNPHEHKGNPEGSERQPHGSNEPASRPLEQ